MRENNDIDVVKTIAPRLALVGFVFIFVGLTDLGQAKIFRFVLGEVAVATAIAYSCQMARGNKVALFKVLLWFAIASIGFAQAAWLAVR